MTPEDIKAMSKEEAMVTTQFVRDVFQKFNLSFPIAERRQTLKLVTGDNDYPRKYEINIETEENIAKGAIYLYAKDDGITTCIAMIHGEEYNFRYPFEWTPHCALPVFSEPE
ncbi:hypothetical protein A2331_03945 [Candidatus Falkowbacteria bacterium RIFOXYB2_FULL_34_18]|uniref:Uncharacterized protein n=1 Tax=Candidatus Falkowbacteria bacterium RIFOXYD2_FULL_34_120 TaxID=1798007 RepID=A0A1F5TPD5_9BACT|nr:MAG: hypothetical protein A2331_03945 [Candidatus Falkowbacteria bacterium RIFOXYB2_FULL_34_18]OGF29103.1 MAG: hypothetical protein A2500_03270 [Candidatus Falkowbacteria bacterium RIFOXYC12_FULL_34_55]OGF36186.1 MAG: hypothetical protein A2466_04800 [Candidatus Falkowbacteria bacterium RIFOXYC2_FULL_34_220]OGF38613.1 MAG: hypothetical protein A2515_02160 [Candidatus Falkowbacteria bacterium RIFOXYD12_FULL_34_57]OGF40796.1 MAG: hypothetical protein A2531_06805 [Candidatus Falkowbacteria bact